jgi:large subunit ribosomal protein L4
MSTVTLKTRDGKDAGSLELDATVFGVQPNVPVMHQVVTAQLAARRSGTQSTKTRAEVSGGGKKPFKQKGTGNARQGSTRSPHFSGGGVALGPKPRKYNQKTPKKMVKLALRSALSDRAARARSSSSTPGTSPRRRPRTPRLRSARWVCRARRSWWST